MEWFESFHFISFHVISFHFISFRFVSFRFVYSFHSLTHSLTQVKRKHWGEAAAKYGLASAKAWGSWERSAAAGLVETQLAPDLVMGGKAHLRLDRFRALLPQDTPPLPRNGRGGALRIFIDHGRVSWHQEVFYAVAKNLEV